MIRPISVALCAGAASALLAAPASASPYTAEYVFGDSLSDNGNIAAALHLSFPDPPSYHDSFTNGPVAVQLLAQAMGLPLDPSLWTTTPVTVTGTNYAVGGATAATGSDNINLPQQIGAYSFYKGSVADPDALYVVMIGGNDVRDAALGDPALGPTAIGTGVATELAGISALYAEGAKNFLVVNVPNVGAIPDFAEENPSLAATATTYSELYDLELASGLATAAPGATLDLFDLFGLNTSILANAASYGFTNTTDPCFSDTPLSAATTAGCGAGGANIASYTYWDHIHPTARVQNLWAKAFGETLGVQVAVPEISTWLMLMVGFAGIGFAGYRRAQPALHGAR